MFHCEKLSSSAKTSQHLVEDQQRASAVASLAQGLHEPCARNSHAALGLDRLDHNRGDSRVDSIERGDIAIRKMANRAWQWLERFAERPIPHERERRHRVAMICAVEGNETRMP